MTKTRRNFFIIWTQVYNPRKVLASVQVDQQQ